MRKLCPNFDRDDGLDTVLEVPIPEEMLSCGNKNNNSGRSWRNMKSWIKSSTINERSHPTTASLCGEYPKNAEIQLLLGVIGAPLIPSPINNTHRHLQPLNSTIKQQPIEASMAKYVLQQYIAAVGGEGAMETIESMCAVGKVKMAASEFCSSGEGLKNKAVKMKNVKSNGNNGGEMGGFVVWQKRPDLWCLELVVSGYKISAGSDGKVAWRQTPWHHSHA
ncbi:Protein of unknown function DUF620 [Dillenia turbinata]|uniref:Uncharacterized protein n=1 Tax=Dillenia turbinata TaxID=194707 RepID=A0AAN8VDJ7_9MAGN